MLYDFHIHDVIRVEYRISTDGPSFPRGFAQIENENRIVGGNGAVAALALAAWGAKVFLTGNAVGNDAHAQFLTDQLSGVENLTYEPFVQSETATPYAVLIRAGRFDAGALLSPEAASPFLPRRSREASVARYFIGATDAWGEEGQASLKPDSQDYPSLVGAMSKVAAIYLNLMAQSWPQEMKNVFSQSVEAIFRERFDGKNAIPTLEEVEAYLNAKR